LRLKADNMKGNADTKIYTDKGRDNHDKIKWNSDK